MTNPFLVGRLVYLRPLEAEDAHMLVPWINDPQVRRTLKVHRPMNVLAEEAFIKRTTQDEHHVATLIVHREIDQPIGVCGLHNIEFKNRNAAFGIMIGARDFWGQGLGTEATSLMAEYAFRTLNLHRLFLHVYEYNEHAVRCYERVGFRTEGVLREDVFHEGRYWNTLVMGLLCTEWPTPARTQQ